MTKTGRDIKKRILYYPGPIALLHIARLMLVRNGPSNNVIP